MNKETLKVLADKLMFTMEDSEYETLVKEFDIILSQLDLIGEIPNISEVEPMTHPFPVDVAVLREDTVSDELEIDDILKNSGEVLYNQVKLPKVVE